MHEMALTRSVVDLVASRTRGRRVALVRVEVGALVGVVPDAMLFCFDLACEGTGLDGARLEVVETPGELCCATCGDTSPCPDRILLCRCGSADVTVVRGEELRVLSVDLMAVDVVPVEIRGEDACA